MTILNVAVIGSGGRARAHFPIIQKLSDKYKLLAICDIDEERAKATANELGVNAYTDIEQMLDKEKPNACLIATQAESHHVIGQVLADRKIHILTETPIALTVLCANLMIESANRNGVYLEVSENVRRWPHERLKRKIVEHGLLGKIKKFYLSYTSGSYHGISGIRAILGSEAVDVMGEFPESDDIRERGYINWSDDISGVYEYCRSKGNYWETNGIKANLLANDLHIFDENKFLKIITETTGEGNKKTIKNSYIQTDPPIIWESHLQQYPLPSEDEVAVADAWYSLYNAIIYNKQLDYGAENAKKDIELLMAIRGSATEGRKISLPMTEANEHEKRLHSEFRDVYKIDIMELTLEHLKKKYTLPDRLREFMYYGKTLAQ